MTVKEMRLLLKGLPSDMDIVMGGADNTLVPVCFENSDIIEVDLGLDEEDDETETVVLFLLVPCTCHIEKEVDIQEPNLN